jgi:NAD-dependent SIR2 family protein deacetylase
MHKHDTDRKCPNCKIPLQDSIINFGENLRGEDLQNGFKNCERADLCIAMGSSLRVTPAADMPEIVGEKGRDLVIINL